MVTITHDKYNYFKVNLGLFQDEDSFDRYVFGTYDKESKQAILGAIGAAYLTKGTVLFDEFNTINLNFANKFLRFLEQAHTFVISGIDREIEANILAIFTSNKNRDELIQELKMNKAVIFRVTQDYYFIPPLRERKEDIALFILNSLIEKKRSNEFFEKLKKINIDGLRLICELNWEENYRGLQNFIKILVDERNRRKIKNEEVSFKEILYALRKMDALKAG